MKHAPRPLAATISALIAAAACTSAKPSPAPLSQNELTARLLTTTTAPAGYTVDPIDTDPPADTPSPTTTGQPDCQTLDAVGDLTQFAPAPAAHVFEIIEGTAAHGLRWLGNEQLYSYPDNNAPHILDQLRTLAAHCPNGASTDPPIHLTIATTPHLGDDSLLLKIRTTRTPQLAEDAIFIRTGTTILVVSEIFTPADTTPSPVQQLAAPALTAYTTPPAKPTA